MYFAPQNSVGLISGLKQECSSTFAYKFPRLSLAETLGKIILKSDVETVVRQYHELKPKHHDEYNFDERELNKLGYQYLGTNKVREAIEIFKII